MTHFFDASTVFLQKSPDIAIRASNDLLVACNRVMHGEAFLSRGFGNEYHPQTIQQMDASIDILNRSCNAFRKVVEDNGGDLDYAKTDYLQTRMGYKQMSEEQLVAVGERISNKMSKAAKNNIEKYGRDERGKSNQHTKAAKAGIKKFGRDERGKSNQHTKAAKAQIEKYGHDERGKSKHHVKVMKNNIEKPRC